MPAKFTIKAQEALQEAQSSAASAGHAEIRPLHLLQAMVQQREGIVRPIFERLGVSPDAVAAAAKRSGAQRIRAPPVAAEPCG